MERKMILLSAPNDYGKSSALRSLIKIIEWKSLKLLDKNYRSIDEKNLEQYEDVVAIGSINLSQDIKIGIATLGDGARYVRSNLECLDRYNCEILILATHTGDKKGTGFYFSKQFAEMKKYKLFLTSPITELSQESKDHVYIEKINEIEARAIIEIIKL